MKENQEEFLDLIREKVFEREKEIKKEEELDLSFQATMDALEQITQVPRSEIEEIAQQIKMGSKTQDKSQKSKPDKLSSQLPTTVQKALTDLPKDLAEEFIEEYLLKRKKTGLAYLFLLIPPPFSGHYLYLQKPFTHIIYFLSIGGFFMWWLLDFFRLPSMVIEHNRKNARVILRKIMKKSQPVQVDFNYLRNIIKNWFKKSDKKTNQDL